MFWPMPYCQDRKQQHTRFTLDSCGLYADAQLHDALDLSLHLGITEKLCRQRLTERRIRTGRSAQQAEEWWNNVDSYNHS